MDEVVASPCVRMCTYDDRRDLCVGCGRNMDEIMGWIAAPPAEQRAILLRAAARLREIRRPIERPAPPC